jgi:hypothetical protein
MEKVIDSETEQRSAQGSFKSKSSIGRRMSRASVRIS